MKINLSKYSGNPFYTSAMLRGSSMAFAVPYILQDNNVGHTVLSNKTEFNVNGKLSKVFFSTTSRFNIYPSKTKGVGREHIDANLKESLKEYGTLLFVSLFGNTLHCKEVDKATVIKKQTNGVIYIEQEE